MIRKCRIGPPLCASLTVPQSVNARESAHRGITFAEPSVDLEKLRSWKESILEKLGGGVGTLDHLVDGVREGHASAVLAASIFHFGEATIAEAKARLAAAGLPVRAA